MRKIFTLSSLVIAALFQNATKSTAQITGFTQSFLVDSMSTQCNLPAPRMIQAHTAPQGTIPPGDSLTVYFNYGDASSDTFKVAALANTNVYAYHEYTFYGTFTIQVIFEAVTGAADTVYTLPRIVSDTCANVSGRLYVDNNNNCTYDAGDQPFAYHSVKVTNNTNMTVYYTTTDSLGNYNIDLPTGFTYDIEKASLWGGYAPSCPALGVQTVTVTGGPYTEDLAYQCVATTNIDVSVSGSAWSFRPGFSRLMYITANTDNGCNNANTTLTLTLDPQLSYTSTIWGPAPNTIAGNVLTWNLTDLNAWNSFNTQIYVYCDSGATVGDTLCNLVAIDSALGYHDSNMVNNTYDICAAVGNAYDPNNKEVMPKGAGTPGYIAAGTNLTYLINFQNTGNDTAINVTIKDTLDANVDINTLHFVSSSHPVTISILPGNIVVFRFDNIMLPDSGANQAASHGYVTYSVRAITNLQPLATIHNTASIYFDFNSPVTTNTTLNTIVPVSVQHVSGADINALVYPNPANDKVIVEVKGNFTIILYDLLGRPIDMQNADDKAIINTTALPQGMYLLRLSNGRDEMTTRINIRH